MNEYGRVRNEHDRATLLAQLVRADAIVAAAEIRYGVPRHGWLRYEESREALWAMIKPEPQKEEDPK